MQAEDKWLHSLEMFWVQGVLTNDRIRFWCFKSVATKGLSTTNLFYHLQQHNVLKNPCSNPKS